MQTRWVYILFGPKTNAIDIVGKNFEFLKNTSKKNEIRKDEFLYSIFFIILTGS